MTATKIEPIGTRSPARDAGRVAVVGGNGLLPIKVAETLQNAGQAPFLVPLRGEADPVLYNYEHQEISVVEFAKLVRSMKAAGVSRVVLAGGVRNRPHVRDLKFDWPTLRAVPYVLGALGKGDDALLRAFIGLLESFGFKVVGAHEVVPDLLSPLPACLTRITPDARERRNIALAMEAALKLGDLDVGQGAIAAGGRVVALEGAEGTDLMIERVCELRTAGRISRRGGVLVKMAKPRQDERADLPAIGLSTVENAERAGLAGIAIEAGRTFILGFGETLAAANKKGLFIETISRDGKGKTG
ncbi:phosphatidate cytidyltransferase [Brucella sp. NF 2653]|uniref:LpxI family protein n=1 Tax=unclassified Brucella TaxID=2632610 RepID=UPI0001B48327|nr:MULTISPECIES: LpxI family protein [unclassified Brucella]EFM63106.1 phosphatidate cytidyltransferase [Brucella sp. NF 2653]